MAWTYSCNNSHGSQRALYELKEHLKTAGWTVLASGDGTGGTYGAASDVLTTYSTTTEPVAGAVTNHSAWWLLDERCCLGDIPATLNRTGYLDQLDRIEPHASPCQPHCYAKSAQVTRDEGLGRVHV